MIVGIPAFCVFLATVSRPSFIRWGMSVALAPAEAARKLENLGQGF
jgi:hypothetical protein